jgi:threonine dehydrogenase-like Zn-dependent dehydrogenase
VGLFAIASAKLLGAGRIFAVDSVPSRLELARGQGAEIVNYEKEDPVEIILQLTGGIGVDRVIDAVGVDAERAHSGPAKEKSDMMDQQFKQQLKQVAPDADLNARSWKPGDAPSQALVWEMETIDKAGTLAIIGVYPDTVQFFPLGKAMEKNLTLKMGNCNHRRYIPMLLKLVASGTIDPLKFLTQVKPITSVYEAYKEFDARKEGWVKVEIVPGL